MSFSIIFKLSIWLCKTFIYENSLCLWLLLLSDFQEEIVWNNKNCP